MFLTCFMIIHNTYVQSPTFLSSLIHYMYVLYIHSYYPHLFNPIIFFHLSWFIFMYHPDYPPQDTGMMSGPGGERHVVCAAQWVKLREVP